MNRSDTKSLICGLAIVYVLAYSVLSAFGRYEPDVVGLNGVKVYAWAPLGFYDRDRPWPRSLDQKTSGWNSYMTITFLPLWQIDFRLIHTRRFEGV